MSAQKEEPVIAIVHHGAFPHERSYIPHDDLKSLKHEEQTAVKERLQSAADTKNQQSLIEKRIKTVAVIGAGPAGVI
jgi:hypothetical protein